MASSSSTLFNAKESGSQEVETLEWDGEVIEGAHDAEFESGDVDPNDAFMPSIDFMSMASSVSSPALEAAVGSGSANPEFDALKNMGGIHRAALEKEDNMNMSEDDLLEMGGDPEFLWDDDEKVDNTSEDDLLDMGGDPAFLWDGTVDEGAHLD
eukprot:CAMPEP_0172313668 /NCGR_PEP_ID=MMETSP1058-20130122/20716_1 /TAXON_ID=83371 /ORGANISM="Detonula confervacea, Strain CCMP 353" /LENGTH=153 /DNA_ID=CAMNT_0013027363 /DNA_START=270 /DNA_END=731 /DNA_ORIENTATION=+